MALRSPRYDGLRQERLFDRGVTRFSYGDHAVEIADIELFNNQIDTQEIYARLMNAQISSTLKKRVAVVASSLRDGEDFVRQTAEMFDPATFQVRVVTTMGHVQGHMFDRFCVTPDAARRPEYREITDYLLARRVEQTHLQEISSDRDMSQLHEYIERLQRGVTHGDITTRKAIDALDATIKRVRNDGMSEALVGLLAAARYEVMSGEYRQKWDDFARKRKWEDAKTSPEKAKSAQWDDWADFGRKKYAQQTSPEQAKNAKQPVLVCCRCGEPHLIKVTDPRGMPHNCDGCEHVLCKECKVAPGDGLVDGAESPDETLRRIALKQSLESVTELREDELLD